MIEKVNPSHPDKLADRIAGAIVDLAYRKQENPKVAVEVLIGHGSCYVIVETSEQITQKEVKEIVDRIAGKHKTHLILSKQDPILSKNQKDGVRCGDNGIFKGVPLTREERELSAIAKCIYKKYPYDGKYIMDGDRLIICQSRAETLYSNDETLREMFPNAIINPLGEWIGGTDVDAGATNRKLGSDMAQSVTGGGLHGKDLSKADVSVNIYAFLKAQERKETVELCCAIGDDAVDGKPYKEIVEEARGYIKLVGGFERFAEWGLF